MVVKRIHCLLLLYHHLSIGTGQKKVERTSKPVVSLATALLKDLGAMISIQKSGMRTFMIPTSGCLTGVGSSLRLSKGKQVELD